MGSLGAMQAGSRDRYQMDAENRRAEARAGRHRGASALQGLAGRDGHTTRRRAQGGHGLLGLREYQGSADESQVHPHHCGRPAGKPRSRRHHHQGSAQLRASCGSDSLQSAVGSRQYRYGARTSIARRSSPRSSIRTSIASSGQWRQRSAHSMATMPPPLTSSSRPRSSTSTGSRR